MLHPEVLRLLVGMACAGVAVAGSAWIVVTLIVTALSDAPETEGH